MSLNINFKKGNLKKSYTNLVLFVDEKFGSSHLKKYISSSDFAYITDLLKASDTSKKMLIFEVSAKKKLL